MLNVMVDIETYGLSGNAAIASIGAVIFDLDKEFKIINTFYRNIDQKSNKIIDRSYDESVLKWWAEQNAEVVESLENSQFPIDMVINDLFSFIPKNSLIWCQGLDFDIPVIKSTAEALSIKTPWKYNSVRCSRTILRLVDIRPKESAMKHNALEDAINQAAALNKALLSINKGLKLKDLLEKGLIC